MATKPQSGTHLDADQLSAFAEGALPAQERALCMTHLAECARCRAVVFLAQAASPVAEPAPARPHWFTSWAVISLGGALAAGAIFAIAMQRIRLNHPTASIEIAVKTPDRSVSPPFVPSPLELRPSTSLKQPPAKSKAVPAPAVSQPISVDAPMDEPTGGLNPGGRAIGKASKPAINAELSKERGTAGRNAGYAATSTAAPVALGAIHGQISIAAPAPAPAASASAAADLNQQSASSLTQNRISAGALRALPKVGSAGVSGTLTDAAGAIIPGAKVALDLTTGTAHRDATTDATGHFTISALPPGKYRLLFSSPGFENTTRELDLAADELAQLDSRLQVGSSSEAVEVNASIATLNTQAAEVASLLPSKLPMQTSVSNGQHTLALDSSGVVFLRKKTGSHWKKVHGPWRSRINTIELTAANQFHVENDQGSWLSADGEHWHYANSKK